MSLHLWKSCYDQNCLVMRLPADGALTTSILCCYRWDECVRFSEWGQRRISNLSPFLFSVSNRNLHISTMSCFIVLDFWRFPVCSRKKCTQQQPLTEFFCVRFLADTDSALLFSMWFPHVCYFTLDFVIFKSVSCL